MLAALALVRIALGGYDRCGLEDYALSAGLSAGLSGDGLGRSEEVSPCSALGRPCASGVEGPSAYMV